MDKLLFIYIKYYIIKYFATSMCKEIEGGVEGWVKRNSIHIWSYKKRDLGWNILISGLAASCGQKRGFIYHAEANTKSFTRKKNSLSLTGRQTRRATPLKYNLRVSAFLCTVFKHSELRSYLLWFPNKFTLERSFNKSKLDLFKFHTFFFLGFFLDSWLFLSLFFFSFWAPEINLLSFL